MNMTLVQHSDLCAFAVRDNARVASRNALAFASGLQPFRAPRFPWAGASAGRCFSTALAALALAGCDSDETTFANVLALGLMVGILISGLIMMSFLDVLFVRLLRERPEVQETERLEEAAGEPTRKEGQL